MIRFVVIKKNVLLFFLFFQKKIKNLNNERTCERFRKMKKDWWPQFPCYHDVPPFW